MMGKYYIKYDEHDFYYIFDSDIISEEEFNEKQDYEGYNVFADSLTGEEVINLLNQVYNSYAQLKQRHSLLHDTCIELESEKDEYYKDVLFLEKENRELKQVISKTLRKQYHLIKNEDKTVALLELKSLAGYLGVELE